MSINFKFHNNKTKRSADIKHITSADLYKLLTYPGEEEYLPGVEFYKTKDEALEAAKKWIDGKDDPQTS